MVKKIQKHIFSLLGISLALLVALPGAAQLCTEIISPRFKTLKVSVANNFMMPPVIRLGTQDRLIISFDEIAEQNSWLQYRVVHCDRDWCPSNIVESEYLDGFNIADIEDFEYSSNTYVHFVNYRIELPNNNMAPVVSGNYVVQVFDRDAPDETILQARFQITEGSAAVLGNVSTRTDRGVNDTWQQLDLAVMTDGLNVGNPYQDVFVTVEQNNRLDTRRMLRTPLRVEGNRLVYAHAPELIFGAGNEYRRFETISVINSGMRVESMRYGGTNYHAWIHPDAPRNESTYSFDRTQHGRFLVREYNATDSDLGADYVTVHFTLDAAEMPDADIYVDGEFSHGLYADFNRMTYDRELRAYTAEIPLKQGSYNYQYVVVPKGGGKGSPSKIEGDKYETENEYGVSVYFRPVGARFDRLVGYGLLQSR